tara:strand:+ start:412 stop:963 length:552 start_codon:yes stop_codon:yes gene_type:complete
MARWKVNNTPLPTLPQKAQWVRKRIVAPRRKKWISVTIHVRDIGDKEVHHALSQKESPSVWTKGRQRLQSIVDESPLDGNRIISMMRSSGWCSKRSGKCTKHVDELARSLHALLSSAVAPEKKSAPELSHVERIDHLKQEVQRLETALAQALLKIKEHKHSTQRATDEHAVQYLIKLRSGFSQ